MTTALLPCGKCDGRGGTYGPGYLADGRHVDSGMWSPCFFCQNGYVYAILPETKK